VLRHSVCFALDALGLREDDARAITQTGGFAVPRWAGLQLHDARAGRHGRDLRGDPGSYGVTSGVAMHMQSRLRGVVDRSGAGPMADLAPAAHAADPLAIVEAPEGKATVATYTVLHGRDGGPERAVLICDLPGGAVATRCSTAGPRHWRGRGRRVDRAQRHPHACRWVNTPPLG